LTYHNGPVLYNPDVRLIFWGPNWSNAAFAGDIVTGLDTWYGGFSGSSFAASDAEYYGSSGQIPNTIHYLGYSFDSSAPPSSPANGGQAVAEACKLVNNSPAPNTIYVLVSQTQETNTCNAYHTSGGCGMGAHAKPIVVVYQSYTTGNQAADPTCYASDLYNDLPYSSALKVESNVTAHEVIETITNPYGTAWRDSNGQEIADKCFGIKQPQGVYQTFSNGFQWRPQGMWSNAAYLAGTGTPNSSGQPGCIW
jgi:hypothetical protein